MGDSSRYGPRRDVLGADDPAQPRHLGADRHHVEVLFVEQHGEVIGAQAFGVAAEQHQDVGVPAGQRAGAAGWPCVVGDLPAGPVGAEHGQACAAVGSAVGGSGQPQQGQLVLDGDDGRADQGQGLRRRDLEFRR